ncbi:hypothetical protein GCK72_026243 [Caenorhabditis remanei]|uniref:Protein kinase domain-containing protein n=1 Tax=Caenorhabditis remanei TaxID=31234 RepID=A0A6A5G5A4_CAERE|nr:hypothetical protein GCK72_026243 [Caenorhabditis remanei]KAF1749774.1 hypothetical protein GCK72_026243 [Caenorhabditis remanei]
MTCRIDILDPVDIALVDDELVAVLSKDSVSFYSTTASCLLESHRVDEGVNTVYAEKNNVYLVGKEPIVYTIDTNKSTLRQTNSLPGITNWKCNDFHKLEKVLLLHPKKSGVLTKSILLYDVKTDSVVRELKTDVVSSSSKFRKESYEVMTTGMNDWSMYDLRGSSKKAVYSFSLKGSTVKQGYKTNLSYCETVDKDVHRLFTWSGETQPSERWSFDEKKWFLGLIDGNRASDAFVMHGTFKNSQLVLTDVKNVADHKPTSFFKYGVKSPNQTMFDILPGKVFATGCSTGVMLQSAEFDVANYKNHSEKLREACRKAKSRVTEDKEMKELKKINDRYEAAGKRDEDINVYDNDVTEEKFIIGKLLGTGSFGSVFKCTSKKSDKEFALKYVMNQTSILSKKFEIEREVLIQRELRHENIVKMYAAFRSNINICFVLELMQESLYDVLNEKRGHVMNVKDIARMTECVANALSYCHQRCIIHRDLKPQNILHNLEGVYKVTDFGSATDERHGTFCGTQGYMAPEVITRSKQTTALDCYSLGIVIHQCTQGKLPFQLPTGHVSDYMVSKCKYNPPVTMNLSIRALTQMLIRKNAEERWTANQVLGSQLIRDYRHQTQDDVYKRERQLI